MDIIFQETSISLFFKKEESILYILREKSFYEYNHTNKSILAILPLLEYDYEFVNDIIQANLSSLGKNISFINHLNINRILEFCSINMSDYWTEKCLDWIQKSNIKIEKSLLDYIINHKKFTQKTRHKAKKILLIFDET